MRTVLDIFAQIFRNLWAHKLRSFLTMFGIAWGVGPQLSEISYLPLKEGRWLNELDGSQKRNVIVLGNELLKTLFPGRPAVGAFVLLNGIRFEVVGSMPHLGRGDNNWLNMRAYIPFQVMATYFPLKGENHENSISFIEYQPRVTAEHLLAQDDVYKIVARNHGFDASDTNAFDGWDTLKESQMVGTIFDAMNMFLGAVGIVTLALGAIGVMNIMLVTVSERTHEIGLRKALGATNRSILFHFFLEGLLLTLSSGLIGMGLATVLMAMLGTVHGPGGFDPPKLVPMSAMLAIGSLTLAGVHAGLYPARNAAMLQPVEALRLE